MLVLVLAAAATAADVTIDESKAGLRYDGHGALSAGASSRLLWDYDEPQRSDILDLLFKPNYGGALHHIKVEIGGDGQSTDGTEASHKHTREDLSCQRPYEFWLLQEARRRNPDIQTYVLSWASPAWVGNQTGYYSDDEIAYHVSWLECTKQWDIGTINYIGNWNERPWGTANWTKKYRAAMDAAGFQDTKIIIPDGGDVGGIESAMASDSAFEASIAGIGVHYPCNRPQPAVISQYGKKYWSSEDYSTVGDWAGAACWGRVLNQNFVRMNQTSTIAWSLIWSVYNPGFPYFGNGLMYAMTPWSGYYEAGMPGSSNGGAIWTNAHTCQFTEVGWQYLPVSSGGSGMLSMGGSFVTLVEPGGGNFTLVLEKLEGRCLRCAGQTTSTETVSVKLSDSLAAVAPRLQLWITNETTQFLRFDDIVPEHGAFEVVVPKDSIVTVSSYYTGQSKAAVSIPTNTPFPSHLADDFDSYKIDGLAKYFADNGGSFQVAADPHDPSNKVYKQWSPAENGVNRWGRNVDPVSLLGNATWSKVTASVVVKFEAGATPPPSPPPPTSPPTIYTNLQNQYNGMCLDVQGRGTRAGVRVDVWTCVSAYNEAFMLNNVTGELHIQGYDTMCVSDSGCAAGSGVCIQPCSSATKWKSGPGNTIIKDSGSNTVPQCLQSSSKQLDGNVIVANCNSPPTSQEVWKKYSPTPTPPTDKYVGLCVHADKSGEGTCLLLDSTGAWILSASGSMIASGTVKKDVVSEWTSLAIEATGTGATAIVDGVNSGTGSVESQGMVSIRSGFHYAYFDNFTLTGAQ